MKFIKRYWETSFSISASNPTGLLQKKLIAVLELCLTVVMQWFSVSNAFSPPVFLFFAVVKVTDYTHRNMECIMGILCREMKVFF